MHLSAEDELQRALGACLVHPNTCALRHLTRASRAVVSVFTRALAPSGLTGHQFNILMTLAQSGAMSVGALASQIGSDSTTIPRAIAPLARARLLVVKPGADRRERLVDVTAAGRRRLAQALPAWEGAQRRIVAAIGEPGWRSLTRRLRTIARTVGR